MEQQVRLMMGNEACAEGALLAGCRFFAGYPITPSSEIAEIMARRLPLVDGKFIQMEDEIASMGAVIGASLAGLKSMTATSGPGFSLKQENLGYACLCEVPCVVVDVMRGGPSTGLPTHVSQADVMQARWGPHGDHSIIALAPASVTETLHLTVKAFNLSEQYRIPVNFMLDEVIGHMRERVVMPGPGELETVWRKRPGVAPEQYRPFAFTEDLIPPLADFGTGYRYHVTGLIHDEAGFPTNQPKEIAALLKRLHDKMERYRGEIEQAESFMTEDAEILLVCYGSTARVCKRAVRESRAAGLKTGMLRLVTLWPFPERALRACLKTARQVLVPELNQGQMVYEVERVVGLARGQRSIPVEPLGRYDGELMEPEEVLAALDRMAVKV